jgi:hypothetical protein
MEQVLDLYAQPPDEEEPLVTMDETCKELHSDLLPPLPMEPGRPLRQDDKHRRRGARPIFLFFAPLLGWRRADLSEHRTRRDWARQVKRLLEEDFPKARKVKLVCDNLNTHHIGSLYATFPAEEAHRLARRLEITYTPRNGSWLNIAEIELSIMSKQCLNRRISEAESLATQLQCWTAKRNGDGCVVHWQFKTPDARIKLRHLYPQN